MERFAMSRWGPESAGLPGGRPEHLLGVPAHVLFGGYGLTRLRREQALANEPKDEVVGRPTAANEVRGHGDLHAAREAEHATVEQLVVEAAEAQAVVDGVGAVERPPAH